jgi:tetratricopeptide (TPR) repeat protein
VTARVGTWRTIALPLAAVVLFAAAGCAAQPQAATQPAATQPAVAAQNGAPAPLSDEALLAFDELPPAPAPENPTTLPTLHPRAQEAVEQATQKLDQQDAFAAVRLLERAAGFNPDHPKVRRMLGLAYARQKNWAKALDNFRSAAEVAPDDLTLQVWLGLLAVGQKRHEDAVLAFRRALKCSDAEPSEPLAAEALLRLAGLLREQGYYTASLDCYERLGRWVQDHGSAYTSRRLLRPVVLRPERLLTARGELLLDLRRPDEAADVLDRAFRLDRTDTRTARLLLRALLAADRIQRAEDTLMDLAVEPAQKAQLGELAGMICQRVGDPALPRRIWRRYRQEVEVHGPLAVELARIARRMGAADEAALLLSDALEAMPGNVATARELVKAKAEAGDAAGALKLLVDVLAADPSATPAVREAVRAISGDALDEPLARRLVEQAAAESKDRRYAAHYVAGTVAERLDLEHLAAEQYRAALDEKGDFVGAADALADIYLRQRRFDRVDRLLADVRKEDTGYFAEYLLGKVALARGHSETAVAALRRAHELNGTHLPTTVLLARAYRTTGQSGSAARTLRQAIARYPERVDLYRRLFDLHASHGEHTEAEGVVQLLRRRTGDDLTADLLTVELHLARGEYEQARELLEDLGRRAPGDPQVELLEVRAAVETAGGALDEDEFARAVRVLSRAVERADGDGMALRLLTQLLERPGRNDEAVAVWQRLYQQTRHRQIARLYVAALIEADQHATAVNVLDDILENEPESDWARWVLLDSLEQLDRTDEAIRRARQWLFRSAGDTEKQMLRRRLLKLYRKTEDYEPAQKLLDGWLEDARDADTRQALRVEKIRLYGKAGQYDEAVAFATGAMESIEQDLPLKLALLQVLNEGEQYLKAVELVEAWLADAGGYTAETFKYWRVNLRARAGQLDRAEQAAREWIEEAPDQVPPRAAIVAALVEAEHPERALLLVDRWLAERTAATQPATMPTTATAPATAPTTPTAPAVDVIRPKLPDEVLRWCRITAVRLLLLQTQYGRALERIDRYEGYYEGDAELLSMRASCLDQLGRGDEALATLEKALARNPDDATINNDLGYMYADRGIELAKAERLIRRALTDRPDEVAFLDSLAWVFYKQGRLQAAARVFERAIETAEGEDGDMLHPIILDHAGDTYWRLGRREDALELWRQALSGAKEESFQTTDVKHVLSRTPGKIAAAEADEEPQVAPLAAEDNPEGGQPPE